MFLFNEENMKTGQLCELPNGREIFAGDRVYRTKLKKMVTAKSMFYDYDGDGYLEFEEGGNALVVKVSDWSKDRPVDLR